MFKDKEKEDYEIAIRYRDKSNPLYWEKDNKNGGDLTEYLTIEDIIESNDNNGQFTSVYYNINNIYDGMAIFKALTNKSILDALDEELDDDYRDTALEGFTINIGLYKDNNYKEVREKTIAITVSDDYGARDIAHQDIINADDILINKTREILCNDDQ